MIVRWNGRRPTPSGGFTDGCIAWWLGTFKDGGGSEGTDRSAVSQQHVSSFLARRKARERHLKYYAGDVYSPTVLLLILHVFCFLFSFFFSFFAIMMCFITGGYGVAFFVFVFWSAVLFSWTACYCYICRSTTSLCVLLRTAACSALVELCTLIVV